MEKSCDVILYSVWKTTIWPNH